MRIVVPLIAYIPLSMSYALINLAFDLPFGAKCVPYSILWSAQVEWLIAGKRVDDQVLIRRRIHDCVRLPLSRDGVSGSRCRGNDHGAHAALRAILPVYHGALLFLALTLPAGATFTIVAHVTGLIHRV